MLVNVLIGIVFFLVFVVGFFLGRIIESEERLKGLRRLKTRIEKDFDEMGARIDEVMK